MPAWTQAEYASCVTSVRSISNAIRDTAMLWHSVRLAGRVSRGCTPWGKLPCGVEPAQGLPAGRRSRKTRWRAGCSGRRLRPRRQRRRTPVEGDPAGATGHEHEHGKRREVEWLPANTRSGCRWQHGGGKRTQRLCRKRAEVRSGRAANTSKDTARAARTCLPRLARGAPKGHDDGDEQRDEERRVSELGLSLLQRAEGNDGGRERTGDDERPRPGILEPGIRTRHPKTSSGCASQGGRTTKASQTLTSLPP